MSKINVLDPSIYNLISAGEVAVNPASVVKELIENSLDAKATKIIVEITSGGTDFIKVTDNGQGIEKSQVRYAFLPHATSKIANVEDIFNIVTLGFRGEALASICNVSKVTLRTRTADEEVGTYVEVNAGIFEKQTDVATNVGTEITIYNLFYNTPARLKFLKSKPMETREVSKVVTDMMLSNPDVQFEYKIDGRLKYKTNGDGLCRVIEQTEDPDFLEKCYLINVKEGKYKLYGYATLPGLMLENRVMKCFVNGRVTVNHCVASAVQSSYVDFVMRGYQTSYILFFDLPYDEVDVNITPQKTDVKFQNDYEVFAWIAKSVKNSLLSIIANERQAREEELALQAFDSLFEEDEESNAKYDENYGKNKINGINKEKSNTEKQIENWYKNSSEIAGVSAFPKNDREELNGNGDLKIASIKAGQREINQPIVKNDGDVHLLTNVGKEEELNDEVDVKENNSFKIFNAGEKQLNIAKFTSSEEIDDADVKVGLGSDSEIMSKVKSFNANLVKQQFTQDSFIKNNNKVLGVLFQTYIVVQSDDNVFVIDQHAAHERFLYDKYMNEINRREVTIQDLMVPFTLSADNDLANFLDANKGELEKMGFKITSWGANIYKIEAVPMILSDIDLGKFIDDIYQNKVYLTNVNEQLRDKIATKACKSAVKAGMSLKQSEIDSIMEMIKKSTSPLLCPHGRPYVLKISKKDIEKWFKRIV